MNGVPDTVDGSARRNAASAPPATTAATRATLARSCPGSRRVVLILFDALRK